MPGLYPVWSGVVVSFVKPMGVLPVHLPQGGEIDFPDHLRALLVIDALAHAHGVRGSFDGDLFHSDYANAYNSQAFRAKEQVLVVEVRQSSGWCEGVLITS